VSGVGGVGAERELVGLVGVGEDGVVVREGLACCDRGCLNLLMVLRERHVSLGGLGVGDGELVTAVVVVDSAKYSFRNGGRRKSCTCMGTFFIFGIDADQNGVRHVGHSAKSAVSSEAPGCPFA